jgi:hypothetical protein
MNRAIVHMDLDNSLFPARLVNPKLIGMPLIIGEPDRGVVALCSTS